MKFDLPSLPIQVVLLLGSLELAREPLAGVDSERYGAVFLKAFS